MVIAHQRHAGREVERLAEPLRRAKQEEVPERARQRRRHADQAPHLQAAEDRGLAADAVHQEPGERRAQAVDPREPRAEQAELHRAQVHPAPEHREDREDHN